jgi:hypothetical protein
MTITRVIRDGVEFFTIDETGESGMSESGLARLCGVSTPAVSQILRSLSLTSDHEKSLEPHRSNNFRLKLHKNEITSRGQNSDIVLVRAKACARVIEYYAFDSRRKTEEALFAYRKFAELGINAWIQEITHWSGNPIPKSGIVVDFKTIDQLMDKKLDATTYRVYLILQKAIRLRMTLTPEEIMQRADVGRSAYMNAVGKLQDAKLLPDWCKVQRRMHPERDVRDRLQAQLGGKTEAYTKWGLIDLLTETELIEVKIVHQWKDAIGHLIAKSRAFPNHTKRLHLFGPEDPRLDHIEEICTECNIRITFEKVAKPMAQTTVLAIDRES